MDEKGKLKITLTNFFLKCRFQKEQIIFLFILFFQVINIIYWGTCKEGYFGDELYSYQFVCQTDYPSINANRPGQSYLNNWHFSEYYQDYFTITENEAFDFVGVYNSIKKDVHPPLYYIFLLIMCSFFRKFTKWSFIILNIIFFVLSNIYLYKISKKLIKSKIVQLIPSLFWGFSVGAVTTAVFGRMYMQLTCATILYVYVHIGLIKDIFYMRVISKKTLFSIFLVTIFGVLTQYYFLIFAFFLSAGIWIFLILYKRKYAIEYMITMFMGLACSYAIFPTMYKQIFKGYRGDEAFENIKSKFDLDQLRNFVGLLSKEIFAGKLKFLVICALILFLIGIFIHLFRIDCLFGELGEFNITLSRKKLNEFNIKIQNEFFISVFIFVAVVMDIIVLAKIAPYRSDRYIFNIQAISVLLFVVFGISLCEWLTKSQYLKITGMLIIVFIILMGYVETGVGYLYKGTNERIEIANAYADLPIILLTRNNARYTSCNDAFFFLNGQKVYPIDENGISDINIVLDEVKATSFVLHVDKSYDSVDDKLDAVKKNVGSEKSQWIYSTNTSAVYLIDR